MRGCSGVAEDLRGRAVLEDAAAVEERDAVGDLAGEAHLVGGDQHRHAAVLELADHVEHLADQLGVEGRGDLVEQQQLGLHGQRPHDRDPLLLAARELVGVARRACRPDRSGRAARRPARSAPPTGGRSTRRGPSVTFSSTVRCGNRLNDWNTMPSRRRSVLVEPGRRDVDAVEQDAAVVDRLEQVDAAQQRRLARARRADEAHDLVVVDVEVDVGQHLRGRRTTSTRGRRPASRLSHLRQPPAAVAAGAHRTRPADAAHALAGQQPVGETGQRDRDREEDRRRRRRSW